MTLAESLRRVPLFKECSGPTLDAVASALEPISLGAGAVVVRQGDPGDRFFVVAHGALGVSTGSGGSARTLARLGPGDFFGEIALIKTERRTASVLAKTPMKLIVIFGPNFRSLASDLPAVQAKIDAAVEQRSKELGLK